MGMTVLNIRKYHILNIENRLNTAVIQRNMEYFFLMKRVNGLRRREAVKIKQILLSVHIVNIFFNPLLLCMAIEILPTSIMRIIVRLTRQ